MMGRACTSTWSEAVAAGERLPDGLTICPVCQYSFPSYYVQDGLCFECALSRKPQQRRPARARDKRNAEFVELAREARQEDRHFADRVKLERRAVGQGRRRMRRKMQRQGAR